MIAVSNTSGEKNQAVAINESHALSLFPLSLPKTRKSGKLNKPRSLV